MWENVALPLQVVGKKPSDYREDVTDLLQWVGLGERMYPNPSVLSGGRNNAPRLPVRSSANRKCCSCRADRQRRPANGPPLLRLFVELNRLGTSVIIATHDHQFTRQFKAPRIEDHKGHVRII